MDKKTIARFDAKILFRRTIPAKLKFNLSLCDSPFVTNDSGEFLFGELGVELMEDLLEGGRVQASLLVLRVHHRVDRVQSLFSSRRNWDSPTPHPQASVPPPPRFRSRGGAHSLAREGLGESQFRRGKGDIHTPWYPYSIYSIHGLCVLHPAVNNRRISGSGFPWSCVCLSEMEFLKDSKSFSKIQFSDQQNEL